MFNFNAKVFFSRRGGDYGTVDHTHRIFWRWPEIMANGKCNVACGKIRINDCLFDLISRTVYHLMV